MSVINKMLQDLEHRQEAPNANPVNSAGAATVTTSRSVNPLLIGLLLLIIALLAFISWRLLLQQPSNTAPQPVMDSAVAAESKTAVEQSRTFAETVQNQATSLSQDQSTSSPISTEKEPVGELNTVEQNKPLQTVLNDEVQPADKIENTRQSESLLQPELPKVAPVVASNQFDNSDNPSPQTEPVINSTAPQSTSSESSDINTGAFKIEKSSTRMTPQQRVDKLLQQAKASFDKGYISEAIEKFNTVLNVQDSHVEARNLLAVAWYGRSESQQAVRVLNDGLQRYPNVESWRLTAAKIFFRENNPQGAFSYLNVDLPEMSKEFLTMKGTLARQLNQHVAAESVYLRLTEMEPAIGNWWLGLAISQDSQGKAELALASYQSVVKVGGVSGQSLDFAKQRIEELKG